MKELKEFKSRQEWEKFIWQEIIKTLSQTKSQRELSSVLSRLLSNYEKRMMIRRFIAKELNGSGKTYREIGELIWISPSTISAIKKNLLAARGHRSSRFYKKWRKN